jgi:hypothetical protein
LPRRRRRSPPAARPGPVRPALRQRTKATGTSSSIGWRRATTGRLQHAGDPQDHPFDLGGGDVLAADLQHVLGAVREVQPALFVDPHAIAGDEPAVLVEGGCRRLGVVQVLGKQRQAADAAAPAGRRVSPGSASRPSTDTRIVYSGAGRPIDIGALGRWGMPTVPSW